MFKSSKNNTLSFIYPKAYVMYLHRAFLQLFVPRLREEREGGRERGRLCDESSHSYDVLYARTHAHTHIPNDIIGMLISI